MFCWSKVTLNLIHESLNDLSDIVSFETSVFSSSNKEKSYLSWQLVILNVINGFLELSGWKKEHLKKLLIPCLVSGKIIKKRNDIGNPPEWIKDLLRKSVVSSLTLVQWKEGSKYSITFDNFIPNFQLINQWVRL